MSLNRECGLITQSGHFPHLSRNSCGLEYNLRRYHTDAISSLIFLGGQLWQRLVKCAIKLLYKSKKMSMTFPDLFCQIAWRKWQHYQRVMKILLSPYVLCHRWSVKRKINVWYTKQNTIYCPPIFQIMVILKYSSTNEAQSQSQSDEMNLWQVPWKT